MWLHNIKILYIIKVCHNQYAYIFGQIRWFDKEADIWILPGEVNLISEEEKFCSNLWYDEKRC